MSIAILCAIPQEWQHLARAMTGARTEELGPFTFARGSLDGRDVVLAEAGIGKVNTGVSAALLCERYDARTILFSGVAGGVDPSLSIGDVVVGTRVVQHDAGVIESGHFEPYQAGHVPFFNPTDSFGFESAPALVATARAALEGLELPPLSREAGGAGEPPRLVFGTVASGDQYVGCEDKRAELRARFGALATDMEGGALGQAAAALGADWLNIRALSDLAGATSQMDFSRFVEEVARASALILRRLLPAL